jgi:hypothetical protein
MQTAARAAALMFKADMVMEYLEVAAGFVAWTLNCQLEFNCCNGYF